MQPAYIMLDLNEMENKENGIEGWDFDVETYFLPLARSPGTLALLHCYIARRMLALLYCYIARCMLHCSQLAGYPHQKIRTSCHPRALAEIDLVLRTFINLIKNIKGLK